MKRIFLLVCGLTLLFVNSAEARRRRWSNNTTYARPVAAAPVTVAKPVTDDSPAIATASATEGDEELESSEAKIASSDAETTASTSAPAATVKTVSYSTATAQGVANLMAANNRVAHFGGNPGYEGCGCGSTPAAAYNIC